MQNSTISLPSSLGSHWQVATMLQSPQNLCGAHQAKPCFSTLPFSLELKPLPEEKQHISLAQKQWYFYLWAQDLNPIL